jgi:hypothetical protein
MPTCFFLQQAFEDSLHVIEKGTPLPVFIYAGNAQE